MIFRMSRSFSTSVPLHNTTTGLDIFNAVENTVKKFQVDFSKCSVVVTDGGKSHDRCQNRTERAV